VKEGHREGEVTRSDLSQLQAQLRIPEIDSRQIEPWRSAQPEDAGGDEESLCVCSASGKTTWMATFGRRSSGRVYATTGPPPSLSLQAPAAVGTKLAPSRVGCSSVPLSHIIVVMGRHTHHLLLLFFLILHTARAHEHHDELTEEEANAPVDSILWIHIFLQATVWGILFPVGMVFGLSRSRWHVPLQVRPAHLPLHHFPSSTLPALPFQFRLPEVIPYHLAPRVSFDAKSLRLRPQASYSHWAATYSGTRTEAGNSSKAPTPHSPTSCFCPSRRSSLSACTSSCTFTSGRCGPGPYAHTGLWAGRTRC